MPEPLDDELRALLARLAARELDEAQLRVELEGFIDEHRDSEAGIRSWFASLAGAAGADATAMANEHPRQVGAYSIVDVLGEGGMGTVYRAVQTTPVRREVALKLIKLGMDSKAIVRRFEQERQTLALMQHDGIAKVFDCGTSERGQPFFVMELVQGEPLTEYCERKMLPMRERLLLLQQLCAAVEHAHQKGVVHRDLKPGNVLVSDVDGRARIKVIDFGLAKAMGPEVDGSLLTQAGHLIGTPEYMAPEQADAHNVDIDTRADVYSLGVITYEVLVGSLPFSRAQLREGGVMEMQRTLRQVEPARPSTRLTSSPGVAAAIARCRGMSSSALFRVLKSDLDWIVLKALEKDRELRYESAEALRSDLRRFLDHEPLLAGPPSAAYRVRKFVRKHRGPIIAIASVSVTALVGLLLFVAESGRGAVLAAEKLTLEAHEPFRKMILWEWLDAGIAGRRMGEAGRRRCVDELGSMLQTAAAFDVARQYRLALLEELQDPEAEVERTQLAGRAPSQAVLQFFLARSLARQRQHGQAMSIFESLEQDPLLGANVLVHEAALLTTGGNTQHERAMIKLWKADERSPLHPVILYNLAVCYQNLGSVPQTRGVLAGQLSVLGAKIDAAMRSYPTDVRLCLARGWVCALEGREGFRAARPFFERAVEHAGQDLPVACRNLGVTYLNEAGATNDSPARDEWLAKAETVLVRGMEAAPEDADIRVTLAKVQLGFGRKSEARDSALHAIELGGERLRAQAEEVLKHTGR